MKPMYRIKLLKEATKIENMTKSMEHLSLEKQFKMREEKEKMEKKLDFYKKLGKLLVVFLGVMVVGTTNVSAVSKTTIKKYAKVTMLKQYGWGESEYNALVKIVNRESSWNYKAVNKKSGACGLFQALPCSKMKSAGKNYRTNYKTQVSWGLRYIKTRYKTPSKAWAFWLKHHWY